MDIKNLELTEEDFNLIIEGLDAIPEKGASGELMGALFEGLLSDKLDKNSPEYLDRQVKKEAEKRKKQFLLDARREDVALLKGKIIQLKRWLISQGAMKQVENILNNGG